MTDAINWHPNGTPGPWNQMFHDLTVRTSNRACKYPASNICTVIAACKPERTAITNARAIAEVPAMAQFIGLIARMETATEFDTRTDGDGMGGDDAIETLSTLIDTARAILARIDGGAA